MQVQTIPVVYQNECYFVDYSSLHNSSLKFRQMMKPYLDNGTDLQKLQLRILYDKFNAKNVNNFLKICQNQQNDVLDNEVEEICEVAKLFQADQIFNTGINFVHNKIDPNFNITNKFDESKGEKFLVIESMKNFVRKSHIIDLNELEFEDDNNDDVKRKVHSICYQIVVLKQMMKCKRFYLLKDKKVLFMAKQKLNEIFIGEGENFHIKEMKFENSAKICQNADGYNVINTDDQEFKVTYVPVGYKKHFSLKTSFTHNGKKLDWSPKEIENMSKLVGEFNHMPIQSKKNLLLKNKAGHPTFLVRKMDKKTYEIECLPSLNPLIIFALGISDIVGPYSF